MAFSWRHRSTLLFEWPATENIQNIVMTGEAIIQAPSGFLGRLSQEGRQIAPDNELSLPYKPQPVFSGEGRTTGTHH
jgi:hypothetical protein